MAETFDGIVSITRTGLDDVTITLSGDSGDVTLGGPGRDGDMTLLDTAGNTTIRLNGGGIDKLQIRTASGDIVVRLSAGNLTLGGPGADGDLFVRDSNNNTRIHLNGDGQEIRISAADGSEVAHLGRHGNLELGGGGGDDGDVILRDAANQTRIHLDAQNHRMVVRDASGHEIVRLGDFANLKLGSGGHDGDILLYPSSAASNAATSDATIHLDANAGDIILRNADAAEDFDVDPDHPVEPGTVMSLGPDGRLRPSQVAHDKSVVGVVSNAGDYRPGIVLDRQPHTDARQPIALMGKAYVRVTDEGGPITAGDLLTTSSEPGVAMRAADPILAFGAVIGKAIAPHGRGRGLIPMVTSLQ